MSWFKQVQLSCDFGQCPEFLGEHGDAPSTKRVLREAYEEGWVAKLGFHFCPRHRESAKKVRAATASDVVGEKK